MDKETRDAIRMAVSGQKEEPITLKTTATLDGTATHLAGGGPGLTEEPQKQHARVPEFDRQALIIEALAVRNARLSIEVAELTAILQERDALIEANAELLGIERIDRPHQH